MMNSDQLRALADALDDCDPPYYESSPQINRSLDACIAKAANYLRAQADAQPVAEVNDRYSRDGYNDEISVLLPVGTKLYTQPAAPQAEPKREPLTYEQMRAVLIAEARRIAEQVGEKDPDSLPVDEEMLAQVMLAGRAVERAHEIGGSDE